MLVPAGVLAAPSAAAVAAQPPDTAAPLVAPPPDTEAPVADSPLGRLLAAVERESYAAPGTNLAPANSADDVLAVIAMLRRRAPARDRNRAFFAPPSIWARLFRLLSRMG
jgi:hypothetical protein